MPDDVEELPGGRRADRPCHRGCLHNWRAVSHHSQGHGCEVATCRLRRFVRDHEASRMSCSSGQPSNTVSSLTSVRPRRTAVAAIHRSPVCTFWWSGWPACSQASRNRANVVAVKSSGGKTKADRSSRSRSATRTAAPPSAKRPVASLCDHLSGDHKSAASEVATVSGLHWRTESQGRCQDVGVDADSGLANCHSLRAATNRSHSSSVRSSMTNSSGPS